MSTTSCARCGLRPAKVAILCSGCAEQGPLTPEEAARYHERLDEERAGWPVHQPEAFDAPIPGRHWYGGCEPGGDWDSELGRYRGAGPRVNPATGVCESCGEAACPDCGRENCPDHQSVAA